MAAKRRVLFVCSGNATRSQIAEALLRHFAPEIFEVASAGTHPTEVDALAVDALERQGISTAGLWSKSLHEVLKDDPFDYVITLCDKARQECRTVTGLDETLHWNVIPPKLRTDSDPYLQTVLLLAERIKIFVLIKTRDNSSKE